jgi:hypothetical protein
MNQGRLLKDLEEEIKERGKALELAKTLGLSSTQSIFNWIYRGAIPKNKIGKLETILEEKKGHARKDQNGT